MNLQQVADAIDAHLSRFEADPTINCYTDHRAGKLHPYYCARAWRAGAYVAVSYITYQGASKLRREEAEAYLRWLDAGNVGRHYAVPKSREPLPA